MIVKLLSYNIRFGGKGRERELAEVIRTVSPDIVVFQEATDPNLINRLAVLTGLDHWAARHEHSIGYISRLETSYHEWHYPAGAKHSFLEIVLAGTEERIFGLHLSSTFSKWSERKRVREIQALLKSIERHQAGFHVLAGDFNTLAPGEVLDTRRMPAWIRGLVWLSGRDIQRDTIQHIKDSGYVDGYRHLHPDDKGYTFPVWDPHLRLDYVIVPSGFSDRVLSCEVIGDHEHGRKASDHFPLLAEIEFL
ncbi:MAG TPA: endonuclease/exonuclease/phosphatase family protein [Pyrinomonadaceae bacterium]|nr:endonuclease/exonuclease/phosphatase family protein [Pyrinomonadaceae bacterium]